VKVYLRDKSASRKARATGNTLPGGLPFSEGVEPRARRQIIRSLRDRRSGRLALIGSLVVCVAYLLVFSLYPAIYAFIQSLHNTNLSEPFLKAKFVGGQNYLHLIHDGQLGSAIVTTLIYMTGILGELVLGFILAWGAYRIGVTKKVTVFRALTSLPLFVPFFVAGTLWRYMLAGGYGVLPFVLSGTPLRAINWLGSSDGARLSMILVDVWQWTPFVFLIFVAALAGLPQEQLEAAAVDGANGAQVIRRVVLPGIRSAVVFAIIFRVILSFRTFSAIYSLNFGGPGIATETVTIYLYKIVFQFFETSFGSALAVVILVVMVLLSQVLTLLNLDIGSQGD